MTPDEKLAQAIKAAAIKFCEETGQTFDVRIEFVDVSAYGGLGRRAAVGTVTVKTTKRAEA